MPQTSSHSLRIELLAQGVWGTVKNDMAVPHHEAPVGYLHGNGEFCSISKTEMPRLRSSSRYSPTNSQSSVPSLR